MKLETLPHQLNLAGRKALVVVPGRAPLFLLCRQTEHMRKDYIVLKCDACHNFGHAKEDYVRTYATTIAGATVVSVSEDIMDAEKAEATAPGVPPTATQISRVPQSGPVEACSGGQ